MRVNKERGVSILEPKNRGVYTVNFKHPILKDGKGNNKVITKSLGNDVGKDINKAEYLLSQVKEIINNRDCYENYYEFLKAKEFYNEKAMDIVFHNTPFHNEYYSDNNSDILNKFISFNKSINNSKIKDICSFGSGKSSVLMDFVLNKHSEKYDFVISNNSLGLIKNKIKALWIREREYFNLDWENIGQHLGNTSKNEKDITYEEFENLFLELKNYITKGKFKNISKIIENLKDIEVNYEIREREGGRRFNLEEICSLNNKDLDRISSLAYVYFSINKKDKEVLFNIINEMILEDDKLQKYCDLFEEEIKRKLNDIVRKNIKEVLECEIKGGRVGGDFSLIEECYLGLGNIKELNLKDLDGVNITVFNKNNRDYILDYLSNEERKRISKTDLLLWNFNINEEFLTSYNKELLKYLIINGYLNKTKFYIHEENMKDERMYLKERFYVKSFVKNQFMNILKEIGEEEYSFSDEIVNGREAYYLNTMLCNIIFNYGLENSITSDLKTIKGDGLYRTREIRSDLLNNIKNNKYIKRDTTLFNLEFSKIKPTYRYEDLVYLSQEVKRDFRENFFAYLNGSTEETLREFLLRISNDFGGREYRKLCPEYILERKLKTKLTSFLLNPQSVKEEISCFDFYNIIESLMESISSEIMQGIEKILVSNNIERWSEIKDNFEKNYKMKSNFTFLEHNKLSLSSKIQWRKENKENISTKKDIESLILHIFPVNNDSFYGEDYILNLAKNILSKNSIFKAIKGEIKI